MGQEALWFCFSWIRKKGCKRKPYPGGKAAPSEGCLGGALCLRRCKGVGIVKGKVQGLGV